MPFFTQEIGGEHALALIEHRGVARIQVFGRKVLFQRPAAEGQHIPELVDDGKHRPVAEKIPWVLVFLRGAQAGADQFVFGKAHAFQFPCQAVPFPGTCTQAETAEYPYISCNFVHNGERVFEPYVIRELGGKKLAFVGVTTPQTIDGSTPTFFQDETGAYVYGFLQDETGEAVYTAVQSAVDAAREEGADYVVVFLVVLWRWRESNPRPNNIDYQSITAQVSKNGYDYGCKNKHFFSHRN